MVGRSDAGETVEFIALEGDARETGRQTVCVRRDGEGAYRGLMAHEKIGLNHGGCLLGFGQAD